MICIALTTTFQYRATFLSTYVESGVRRRTLAEKLRKLPLAYFGKKDLANLTNTIMSDCALLENSKFSWIPESNRSHDFNNNYCHQFIFL